MDHGKILACLMMSDPNRIKAHYGRRKLTDIAAALHHEYRGNAEQVKEFAARSLGYEGGKLAQGAPVRGVAT